MLILLLLPTLTSPMGGGDEELGPSRLLWPDLLGGASAWLCRLGVPGVASEKVKVDRKEVWEVEGAMSSDCLCFAELSSFSFPL